MGCGASAVTYSKLISDTLDDPNCSGIRHGLTVRLHGLTCASYLNDREATCGKWDDDSQRWAVLVAGDDGDSVKLLSEKHMDTGIRTSLKVRLCGLEKTPDLNGFLGLCDSWDDRKRRWLIRMPSDAVKLVKPANLCSAEFGAGVYADLCTGVGCAISETEKRGITLAQLRALMAHIHRRCEKQHWVDRDAASAAHKQPIVPRLMNLYQATDWVIKPATMARRCSYVELVADGPQQPKWFVSHWWGEPISDFALCLGRHAHDRCLPDTSPYWVCAYANNQWDLSGDVVHDPAQSSFRRAMNLAVGTLSILDRHFVCYSRIWCDYEVWVSIHQKRDEGDDLAPYLYDVYTATGDMAVGLTDGPAQIDKGNIEMQSIREREFPIEMSKMALNIRLQNGKASRESDRRHILNSIVGTSLDAQPPEQHPKYDELNRSLWGRYAAATWRLTLRANHKSAKSPDPKMLCMASHQTALSQYPITSLMFSFAYADYLSDEALRFLAVSMPQTLGGLELVLQGCSALTDDGIATLVSALPSSLYRLSVDLFGLNLSDESMYTLARELPQQLHVLKLDVRSTGVTKAGAWYLYLARTQRGLKTSIITK